MSRHTHYGLALTVLGVWIGASAVTETGWAAVAVAGVGLSQVALGLALLAGVVDLPEDDDLSDRGIVVVLGLGVLSLAVVALMLVLA